MRILIIEDDAKIARYTQQGLSEEGHTVDHVADGEDGLVMATESAYDLIILDINLPGMDGLSICRRLRALKNPVMIIMITARDTNANKIEGLDAGADDYLTKPYSFEELLARIRALDRRRREPVNDALEIGGLSLDPLKQRARFAGTDIDLSGKEFSLLQLFFRRRGHLLSRTVIGEAVWGFDFDPGTNVIDVYINRLRKKIKAATGSDWIETRRNQGYVFDMPPR